MAVPMLDLTRQYRELQSEIEAAALGVLRSGQYVFGPEVEGLEAELCEMLGVHHTIGLSSGTDALLAALMALGVGPGDCVAVPVYSFFATAGVVVRLGARPVFIDVEPTWGNMDVAALRRALDQTGEIKAAIFVHLFGAAAGIEQVAALLAERGIPLIEDAAQAIGSRSNGRNVGSFGLCGCFSTFPTKNLGGVGDGGFLTTDDEAFGSKLRQMRHHGQTGCYQHEFVGGNFRLDPLQAACLRVKLRHLGRFNQARRDHAARYREHLAAHADAIRLPADIADYHTYHQFVTQVTGNRRDRLRQSLSRRGIGCGVYYPLPFHRQPCFRDFGYPDDAFPVAEALSRGALALPIFPELRDAEVDEVVAGLVAGLTE